MQVIIIANIIIKFSVIPPFYVNFTNILQADFLPKFFCPKILSQTVSREKLFKTLSYEKKLLVN